MFKHVVNSYPEINTPLSAKYSRCSAYPTFKERLPKILQNVIDDLKNEETIIKSKLGKEAGKEIDTIVKKIGTLRNGVLTDHPFDEINIKGTICEEVVIIYNEEIQRRRVENAGHFPSWFQTEFLFAECYCYFKLNEIFHASTYLNDYDYFSKAKNESLIVSKEHALQLAKFICENRIKGAISEEERKKTFIILLKCCLWGNKADLSLSDGKAVAANHTIGSEMEALDQNIIVDDTEEVYKVLNHNEEQTIDFILDNAGFELINDLCFADFLVHSGFVKKIIFHAKLIPWFVSDVTPLDLDSTFEILQNQLKSECTKSLVNEWSNYLKNGQWILKTEIFWILPYDYSRMSTVNQELYAELAQNQLAIFKGDLNYRKLSGDIYWDPTTSFKAALRGFDPTNVLALRTVKADCVTGLRKGLFEKLTQINPKWTTTGEYAVIQLSKKSC